ncbi:MAG: NAD(+) synthase, partial [Bacteroidales bacterium]|nr:NAD(+) synthase [Bacteroidales bacterium]
MKNYGFLRVAAATPLVKVADVTANLQQICALTDRAEADGVALVAFPELAVTGYTCGDLFAQQMLIDAAEQAVA